MIIAAQSDVSSNIAKYFDLAFNGNPVSIPRQENKDVVIISKSEYEEMAKAKRNAEHLAKLDRAIEQRKNGTMQEHELIEV